MVYTMPQCITDAANIVGESVQSRAVERLIFLNVLIARLIILIAH